METLNWRLETLQHKVELLPMNGQITRLQPEDIEKCRYLKLESYRHILVTACNSIGIPLTARDLTGACWCSKVYPPPGGDKDVLLSSMTELFPAPTCKKYFVVLLADLNRNLIVNNMDTKSFRDLIGSFGLVSNIGTQTSHNETWWYYFQL